MITTIIIWLLKNISKIFSSLQNIYQLWFQHHISVGFVIVFSSLLPFSCKLRENTQLSKPVIVVPLTVLHLKPKVYRWVSVFFLNLSNSLTQGYSVQGQLSWILRYSDRGRLPKDETPLTTISLSFDPIKWSSAVQCTTSCNTKCSTQ